MAPGVTAESYSAPPRAGRSIRPAAEPGTSPRAGEFGQAIAVFRQLISLSRQTIIYGAGGLVGKFAALLLLPVYTRYLGREQYGTIALLFAAEALTVIVLRGGMQNAFFRFYFDSNDPARRTTVIRTAFWYTMIASTTGLVLGLVFAPELAHLIPVGSAHGAHVVTAHQLPNMVRVIAVTLWADMNYQQLAAMFRAEKRPTSYVIASIVNVLVTIGTSITLVVGFHEGAIGVLIGNVTGTLSVAFALMIYRREVLGFGFSRPLYRAMEHYGLPLVPSSLAISVTTLSDRLFISHIKGTSPLGVYAIGVNIASLLTLLVGAFQSAWPAFAFSIEKDEEAKTTYAYVLTYVLFAFLWAAALLSVLAPTIVHLMTTPKFYSGSRYVPLLAFSTAAYAGYGVVIIGIGRVRKTRSNWIITAGAVVVDATLNLILIPRYGPIGAAIALLSAYTFMFAAMAWRSQRLFPAHYQWRRVITLAAAGAGIVVACNLLSLPTIASLGLAVAYPLLLFPLGFYLAPERARVAALARRLLPAR
jgi:O-antigen/teichoic acid export membrane protein